MNRIQSTCLISLALCATHGIAAETSSFTGLTIGASAALAHTNVDYSGFLDGVSSSKNDFAGGINAGYGIALGERVVLGIGASYIVNSVDFGQVSYQDSGQTVHVDGKLKDHWSIYISPGLRFAPNWLAYAKLGYHHATSEYTDTLMGSGTSSHHGVGYGAGVAYSLADRIELSAEIQHVNLSSASFAQSTGDPSVTEYTVGVNYRF